MYGHTLREVTHSESHHWHFSSHEAGLTALLHVSCVGEECRPDCCPQGGSSTHHAEFHSEACFCIASQCLNICHSPLNDNTDAYATG